MNPIIPVFYAGSNQLAKHTAKSIGSVVHSASPDRRYRVHILHTDLNEESKAILASLATPQIEIVFEERAGYSDPATNGLILQNPAAGAVYDRFLIAKAFPQYQKAVWLDSNTTVQSDVGNLYDIDLGDHDLAACHEQITEQIQVFGDYSEQVVGISHRQFFNGGVLLINCNRFRQLGRFEKFVDLCSVYTFAVMQGEEYLNLACKDHVLYLDPRWNTEIKKEIQSPHPAREAYILHDLANRPLEELAKTAKDEIAREDGYRKLLDQTTHAADRVAVVKKIAEFEREGKFDIDVEEDPPGRQLQPNEIDYLRRSPWAKLKTRYAYFLAKKFLKKIKKEHFLIIREIRGIENLKNLRSGAVITCNHFNAFDSFAMHELYVASGHKRRVLYRVIREGNYTAFPGFYGLLMRNFYTLPLSSNAKTMQKFIKATDRLLQAGNFVLFYPEQSMWWNYRKPKPLQPGAYRFSVKNKVPVVPCFITMRDSEYQGPDGYPVQEYTIHVGKPIYPETALSYKANIEKLMKENFAAWKEIYEKEYDMPLEYTTQPL